MGDMVADNKAENEKKPSVDTPKPVDNLAYRGFSKHLMARINFVTRNVETKQLTIEEANPIVALLVDASSSVESQWQTPFENSNPEHKLPTLMASLQSGQAVTALATSMTSNETFNSLAQEAVKVVDMLDPVTNKLKEGIEKLVGHTNLSKVNSELIFLSTTNRQITATLLFLAFSDALEEVERQIMLLEQRASPQYLSDDGLLVNFAKDGMAGLFSGIVPPFVSFKTHNKTFLPLVINSVSAPIKAPIDENGNKLAIAVEVQFSTRTALDATDIQNIYGI